ncbi:MAG: alpha/beta hydrolase [Bacteroidales bacterium]|nr:alpha/beta hydrolase [Bacteroidales bacterium]
MKHRVLNLLFVGWLSMTASPVLCRTNIDSTYTTRQALIKIQKKYPNARIHSPNFSELRITKNIVYSTVKNSMGNDKNLHLDLFSPEKQAIYPALLMIHGGGWSSGDKSMEATMAASIAREGYVCIPVEYRLSGEAQYPAAVYDIKNAIRWLKTHATEYGIDTTRIAIEGNSAGGQLATLVAMTNDVALIERSGQRISISCKVQAVIDIDGIVDFLAPSSLNLDRKRGGSDVKWLGCTFEEKPQIWKEASPIFWVNERSVPVVFIASSQARFHAGRGEMIELLNQYNIYNKSYTLSDSPHSFWLVDPWFQPTVDYVLRFLHRLFNP